jgi:hypothetical protein
MLTRRSFLQLAATGVATPSNWRVSAATAGETLYNGITLPVTWPPPLRDASDHPLPPPYLSDPPAVIPIDVGRQLFVDDFLIAQTNMSRTWHAAEYDGANPVLRPDQPWEIRDEYADRTKTMPNPTAMPFSDGVFFDAEDRLFKMWYMGGYRMSTCLAVSNDGRRWSKPAYDVVKGTNIVDFAHRDSSTVWLDPFEKTRSRRYKLSYWRDHHLVLKTSPDGIHWNDLGETGRTGDRSTFFFNPFRRKWVFSLRAEESPLQISGRYRRYWEHDAFVALPSWGTSQPVAWIKADSHDTTRMAPPARPELYNLDCVAYESLLLGLFVVWRGESTAREKINEIVVGYSRDGFHWVRPDRRALLPVSETPGEWNYANVQSAGGGCLVVGDELFFYVSGRTGRPGTQDPGVCATGLARLRRDGFASMDWLPGEMAVNKVGSRGSLTTRPVRFSGRHLFVNSDAREGELRVEVLDADGRPLPPFTSDRCVPVTTNGTRVAVRWEGTDLQPLEGQTVRFRFHLTRGRLYAFWVSPWPSGESRGYPAAGGPEFAGPVDVPGSR